MAPSGRQVGNEQIGCTGRDEALDGGELAGHGGRDVLAEVVALMTSLAPAQTTTRVLAGTVGMGSEVVGDLLVEVIDLDADARW